MITMQGISKLIPLLIILCFASLANTTYAPEIRIDFGSEAANPVAHWNIPNKRQSEVVVTLTNV